LKYLLLAFFSLTVSLYSQNDMPLYREYSGQHDTDLYGRYVEVIDFDGDGDDDLFVVARAYMAEETPNISGKLYFYRCGPLGVPSYPAATYYPEVDTLLFSHGCFWSLENIGDLNNDGYEDLSFSGNKIYLPLSDNRYNYYYGIILGNNEEDLIPDYYYEPTEPEYTSDEGRLCALGDINGDGYDDAGLWIIKSIQSQEGIYHYYFEYSIIWGSTFEKQYLCSFLRENWSSGPSIRGLGDINNDGYDDFSLYARVNQHHCQYVYYGNTEIDSIPDFDLGHYIPQYGWCSSGAAYCGDWNGDGIGDFIGSNTNPEGVGLWTGGGEITYSNVHLQYYNSHGCLNSLGYGDFDNDGKTDIVIGNDMATGYNGMLYVYLGDINGTWDLRIFGEIFSLMGTSVAVGDMNNDGYDDIVAGGPGNQTYTAPGFVKIFLGNINLTERDPNISVEEEVETIDDSCFKAYPNPFNPVISFEINIKSDFTEKTDLKIEIFNLKGQKVDTIPIDKSNITKTIEWRADESPSGVYLCRLLKNGHTMQTRKIVLLK